eukprot:3161765-Rhodomonas_salina.1
MAFCHAARPRAASGLRKAGSATSAWPQNGVWSAPKSRAECEGVLYTSEPDLCIADVVLEFVAPERPRFPKRHANAAVVEDRGRLSCCSLGSAFGTSAPDSA